MNIQIRVACGMAVVIMSLAKLKDTMLNVAVPVVTGCLFYVVPFTGQFFSLLKNYLPDGLWAYAFFSGMLIIWERQIHLIWVLITILVFGAFEFFQWKHVISGTGDWGDFFIYLFFAATALFINQYFITKFKPKPKPL
jgi:hypothetical protein